jgi:hypothetical protein
VIAVTQIDYTGRCRPHHYFGQIVLIFVLFVAIGSGAFMVASRKWPALLQAWPDASHAVFLTYVALYASIWIFYLVSYSLNINVQTLRRLLHDRAAFWAPQDANAPDSAKKALIASLREKGKTTITTLAIMIAASTLLTTRSFESSAVLLEKLNAKLGSGQPLGDEVWRLSMLYIGMFFAAAAFVLLLIAIDAIDTSFNEFSGTDNVAYPVVPCSSRYGIGDRLSRREVRRRIIPWQRRGLSTNFS